MGLSRRTVELMLDLVENKISDIIPDDRESARDLKALEQGRDALLTLLNRPGREKGDDAQAAAPAPRRAAEGRPPRWTGNPLPRTMTPPPPQMAATQPRVHLR